MKKLVALSVAAALAIAGTALAATTTLSLKSSPNAYAFNKKKLTAKAGKVTLKMLNVSSIKHGIAIEGKHVDKDGKIVRKGKTSTVTVTLKPGKYEFYCPVPGHKALGMKGTLVVK